MLGPGHRLKGLLSALYFSSFKSCSVLGTASKFFSLLSPSNHARSWAQVPRSLSALSFKSCSVLGTGSKVLVAVLLGFRVR